MERYARQEAISGWNQSRLTETTIAIIGSGPTAFLSALMAVGMGFGNIVLFGCGPPDGKRIGSMRLLLQSSSKSWATLLRRVNPGVSIYAIQKKASPRLLDRVPGLGGVIIAGNDPDALRLGSEMAENRLLPVVAGGSAGAIGFWGPPEMDSLSLRICGAPEWPLMSQIVAGLLVDEIRKAIMPLTDEAGLTQGRQALALSRLPGLAEPEHRRPFRLQCDGLALIGAGALGTWFGVAAGLLELNLPIHVYDDDTIEETNLNRQVLFFDSVGKPKALILASRLKALFPHMPLNGYGMRIDDGTIEHVPAGLLLAACPDSFGARAFLNGVARDRRAALISGGTSATGGSSTAYVPGHTPCLSCLCDIDRLALQETQTVGCTAQVETSVVTSNAITGALMAWGIREMLSGKVPRGIWEYDGRARSERLGVHSCRPQCTCHMGHGGAMLRRHH